MAPMPGSRPVIVQSRSVRHATEMMLSAGLMVGDAVLAEEAIA
jgi:hypothetical protein